MHTRDELRTDCDTVLRGKKTSHRPLPPPAGICRKVRYPCARSVRVKEKSLRRIMLRQRNYSHTHDPEATDRDISQSISLRPHPHPHPHLHGRPHPANCRRWTLARLRLHHRAPVSESASQSAEPANCDVRRKARKPRPRASYDAMYPIPNNSSHTHSFTSLALRNALAGGACIVESVSPLRRPSWAKTHGSVSHGEGAIQNGATMVTGAAPVPACKSNFWDVHADSCEHPHESRGSRGYHARAAQGDRPTKRSTRESVHNQTSLNGLPRRKHEMHLCLLQETGIKPPLGHMCP